MRLCSELAAPRARSRREAHFNRADDIINHEQALFGSIRRRGVSVLRFSEENVCRVCRRDANSGCASTCASDGCWVDHRDWGPNYNKAGIDGIAKVDGGTKVSKKWRVPPANLNCVYSPSGRRISCFAK